MGGARNSWQSNSWQSNRCRLPLKHIWDDPIEIIQHLIAQQLVFVAHALSGKRRMKQDITEGVGIFLSYSRVFVRVYQDTACQRLDLYVLILN